MKAKEAEAKVKAEAKVRTAIRVNEVFLMRK